MSVERYEDDAIPDVVYLTFSNTCYEKTAYEGCSLYLGVLDVHTGIRVVVSFPCRLIRVLRCLPVPVVSGRLDGLLLESGKRSDKETASHEFRQTCHVRALRGDGSRVSAAVARFVFGDTSTAFACTLFWDFVYTELTGREIIVIVVVLRRRPLHSGPHGRHELCVSRGD